MADNDNTGGNNPGGNKPQGTKVTTTRTKTSKSVPAGTMTPKQKGETPSNRPTPEPVAKQPSARQPATGAAADGSKEVTNGLKLLKLYKEREAHEKKIKELKDKIAATEKTDVVNLAILNRQLKERTLLEQKLGSKIVETAQAAVRAHKERQASLVRERTELVETWKSSTLLGKAYSGLTSGLGKLTAGVTASGLAMQGLQRFREAAILRQQIQINQYKDLTSGLESTSKATEESSGFFGRLYDSVDQATGGLVKSAEAAWKSSSANSNLSVELAKARSSAILLGQDTEAVTGLMAHFAQVTGSDNPKALRVLTEGTMGVARTLGITTSEALDFVSVRMQKFGGSAADALVDLQGMRNMVGKTNEEFGKTVIRGDDLVRTIQDISQESSIYAIDQKYVSNIMLTSVTRLQSLGQSYDEAKNKAKAFTESLTGKNAPEFMQALAGQKITSGITQSLKGFSHASIMKNGAGAAKEYMRQYGDALNKAAPGLADRVAKIATDPRMDLYSKQRVIQQMTAGTSVGAEFMAREQEKVIKQVGRSPVVIAELYGVSMDAAYGIIEANDAMMKQLKERDSLEKASVEVLMEKFGITKENAQAIQGDKAAILDLLQAQEKSLLVTKQQEAAEKKRQMARETMAALDEKIAKQEAAIAAETDEKRKKRLIEATDALKAQRAEAEAGSYATKEEWVSDIDKKIQELESSLNNANISPEERKGIESSIAKLKGQKQEIMMKDLSPGDKQMIRLQEGTDKIMKSLEATNLESGNTMKAIFTSMGNMQNLITGATAFGGTILALKALGIDLKTLIAATIANRMPRPGGGGELPTPPSGGIAGKLAGGLARGAATAAVTTGILEAADLEGVTPGTKAAVAGLSAFAGALGPVGALAATAAVGLYALADKLGFVDATLKPLANWWEGQGKDTPEVRGAATSDMSSALVKASKQMGIQTDSAKMQKLAEKQAELRSEGKSDSQIWEELIKELKDLAVKDVRSLPRNTTTVDGMSRSDKIEKIQKTEGMSWEDAQAFIKKSAEQKAKASSGPSPGFLAAKAEAEALSASLMPGGKPPIPGAYGTPSTLGTQTPVPKPLTPAVTPAAQPSTPAGQVPTPVSPAAAMAPTATPSNAPPANASLGDASQFGLPSSPGGQPEAPASATPPGTPIQTASVTPGGPMTGSFQGGINGDGSIILRVENARDFFASGAAQAKGGIQTTAGA